MEPSKISDNVEVIDLISGKISVLSILNEQCLVPNGNDESFFNNLFKIEGKILTISKNERSKNLFCINHYAGNVVYSCKSFKQKNIDIFNKEAQILSEKSNNSLLNEINFKYEDVKITRTVSKIFKTQLTQLMEELEKLFHIL